MIVVCNGCGEYLKIVEERKEWDNEIRIEVSRCKQCDTYSDSARDKIFQDGYDEGREDALEEINNELQEEFEDKIEKLERWIKEKFSTNLDLYREMTEKLKDLDLT